MITTVPWGGNLSAKDWLAGLTQGSLKLTGYFGGPKILFLFLNMVSVNLILSSMTSSGYPLLINISLITLSSSSILLSQFKAL